MAHALHHDSANEFVAADPTASLMRLYMIRLASGVTSGSAHPWFISSLPPRLKKRVRFGSPP
jgi:hypothetical protein